MIRFDGVTYTYPHATRAAVRDATLEVHDGELLLVAGESGAGKSSLLRMPNGLVPHFTGGAFNGSVVVAGRDTRSHKPRDLADVCGFVAQEPDGGAIAATVEDEIAFVLENLGIEATLMRKRVEETLDALGIAALRDRRIDTLSGGERQRVAIASVLVASPRFLVLDEPTSQLDPQSAEEVLQTVLRVSHELGVGVLLAEHRLERVAAFADRLCVVDDGRVRVGPVREMLRASPVAPPVARLASALRWPQIPASVREAREQLRGTAWSAPSPPAAPAPGLAPGPVRLSARGMRVALGGREVLDIDAFDVRAGETVAVVGRNGAGKTTLLRALLGLTRRMRGRVEIDGVAHERVESAARVAALVPQSASRLLSMPRAIDEVADALRLQRLDPAGALDVLGEWGLNWAAERDPRDLSAGEATRLALAAACAAAPGVVLLDEPTRGMDEPWKRALAGRLARWREEGRAVVVVTHDVELVAQAATRVVLLADGRVALDGPAREVLGESVMFSSQMNKVFGDRAIATVEDAIAAVSRGSGDS